MTGEKLLKQTAGTTLSCNSDEEHSMNTIVANVLMGKAAEAQADTLPPTIVMLFCGLGLIASLCVLSLGFDVSAVGF
jgi:hypothetical protein